MAQAHNRALHCENGCGSYEDPGDPDRLEQEWKSVQETLLAALNEAAIQSAYWRHRNESEQ